MDRPADRLTERVIDRPTDMAFYSYRSRTRDKNENLDGVDASVTWRKILRRRRRLFTVDAHPWSVGWSVSLSVGAGVLGWETWDGGLGVGVGGLVGWSVSQLGQESRGKSLGVVVLGW